MMRANRRELMAGAGAVALTAVTASAARAAAAAFPASATPLPLSAVRLRPSEFATAVEVNRAYLHRLSPDRLLHNFRKYAGLEPKAPIYGGWESDTIAGHTLGHYMTALVLTWQQTGDPEMKRRADYIVDELAQAQAKRGNGYVGGLGRKRKDGTIVDGEEIFPEIMKGEIRSGGFDLNGAWSPLYTVHKLFAGLLDVHMAWGNRKALAVVEGLGGYFERVFAALTPAQVQEVLGCEYGGLSESYAEMYAQTKDRRWLKMAELIYDNRVLDPLARKEDKLANFHANTQVPKLIGLARIHEVTNGDPAKATAARFFWDTVTQHHSYVIGGNADREYFSAPDTIADHITEQTCEHCNTYNMLKLTRHLWSWQPDGALFDFYERAHLNHTMAAHDPRTGGFTYMTPLLSGAERGYSTTDDDAFWCCVGSGMEAHAKHGESIFWQGKDGTFFVNLYIPADADWAARRAKVRLETPYPYGDTATLTFDKVASGRFPVALRVPGWAAGKARVTVNGEATTPVFARGYAIVTRRWKAGDAVAITLPMELRTESTPGDADTIALLHGPIVLAADLGPVETKWDSPDPALVGANLLAGFTPAAAPATYATRGVVRPQDMTFVPFYRQSQRRSAVYFKHFSDAAWASEEAAYNAEQARRRDIAARSVDTMFLGEMQPERDHNLTSAESYPVTYRGRQGRDVRSGGFMEFSMKTRPGPLILQATYWGGERGRDFDILVDNVKVATQHLDEDRPGKFFDVDYPLPEALTRGKSSVKVRFVPHDRNTAGPVFGVRLYTAKAGAAA
ncbi:glycoside hydrolase family 127 protein [Sphingomonas adhaesiva]|uniref:glycoside hydrolase family 127 protein n=1 Tax=Sphingomonas adhaesiva TaxID=28212 RepID=UPI002FF6EF42